MGALRARSFWFGRFTVTELPCGGYRFTDSLLGKSVEFVSAVMNERSSRELEVWLFENGIGSAAWPLTCKAVADRRGLHEHSPFWQAPCRTEEQAWRSHAEMAAPLRVGDELNLYIGFPWATWIDQTRRLPDHAPVRHVAEQNLYRLRIQLAGLRHCLNELGVTLRLHTVCQHVYWRDVVERWSQLAIDDVWISHLPLNHAGRQSDFGFRLHPWPLYAVNYEEPSRSAGLVGGKPPELKTIFASFVGAYAKAYPSDARLKLLQFSALEGYSIRITGERWHFEDSVYSSAALSGGFSSSTADRSVVSYNEILSESVFALCPSGAGPNTLRLWEALSVGTIPVLLGDQPQLPTEGALSSIIWDDILLRVADADLERLPNILKAVSMDEIRRRQELGIKAYALARKYTCF